MANPTGSWVDSPDDDMVGGARQAFPFMFEIYDPTNPSSLWQMVLPVNPENYKMTYSPRATINYTQGGVQEIRNGLVGPRFSISGVFGLVGSTVGGKKVGNLVGLSPSGAGMALDGQNNMTGWELYHELEMNMLEFYERFGQVRMDGQPPTDAPNMTNPPQLRFFNFSDNEFWIVQINQFTLTRNTQRRFLYQYDIQMTGLMRVSDVQNELNQAVAIRNEKLDAVAFDNTNKNLSLWSMAYNALVAAGNILAMGESAAQFIASIRNGMLNLNAITTPLSMELANFQLGTTSAIQFPISQVQQGTAICQNLTDTLYHTPEIPFEMTNAIRETQRLLMGLQQYPDLFDASITTTSQASTVPTQQTTATISENNVTNEIITTSLTPALANAGFVSMQAPEQTMFDPNQQTTTQVAVQQISIKDNDTILTIANRNNVDWTQMATLNGLEYPYISADIYDRYSPVLSSGNLTSPTLATDTTLQTSGITAQPNNLVIINEDTVVTVIGVEPTNPSIIYLSGEVGIAYPAGTSIAVCVKALNVLAPGAQIQIPGNSAPNQPISNTTTSWENQIYGIDEAIDADGNMPNNGTGDVALMAGLSNLEMQLQHRIMTNQGELAELGDSYYGSLVPRFIGKINTPIYQQRILLECYNAVMSDPRIQTCKNASLKAVNEVNYFEADVYPNNQSNSSQVSIPLL